MTLMLTYDSYIPGAVDKKILVNTNNMLYAIPDGDRTRIHMLDNTILYVKESITDIQSLINLK